MRLGRLPYLLSVFACLILACNAHRTTPDTMIVPAVLAPRIPAAPYKGTVALQGGTVMTAAGTTIPSGVVVLVDGKISAVGDSSTPVPPGAQIVDVTGKFVTPGILDAHSHLGVYASPSVGAHEDGNEMSRPERADVDSFHSFWPRDPDISRAVEGGVTTVLILPGSGNLFGGRGNVMKLKPGRSAFEMIFPGAPQSLKMACGENPKRVHGEGKGTPQSRMGNVAGYRKAWISAKQYQKKHADEAKKKGAGETGQSPAKDKDKDKDKEIERDLSMETLVGVLEGRILVQNHCYRADEMEVMISLAHEFGYKIRAFHHAIEAYKTRDLLAKEDIAVATWPDWWGFKMEALDTIPEGAALLAESGVRAVIHSDSAVEIQRLNQEAAKAMWAGRAAGIEVSDDTALRWVTANPAWLMGVQDTTGTLQPGKSADVVVWSAHPLTIEARAERVYSDGELLFNRADPQTRYRSDFELGANSEVLP